MSLSLQDIEFRTELPDIPRSMPVGVTEAPCARDRADAMRSLAEVLDLREAIQVDLPFGHALATETGQVEFFSASGALRARDTDLLRSFEDERRDWPDVEEVEDREGLSYRLGEGTTQRLIEQARRLLDRVGLADDGVDTVDVVLGRWALLDESGHERESGPGRATVRMAYAVEGTSLIGPGAKTNVHYDPVEGTPTLARLFHVLRPVVDVREVETGDTELAFTAFLRDPFLVAQTERGGRIVVTAVEVGLLALPADTTQRIAYPAVAVEGRVEGLKDERGGLELRFGRYAPAAAPEALRRAGVAAPLPEAGED